MTLPTAPARIRASAAAIRLARRSSRASQNMSAALTTAANALNAQRCQPEASSNMLKAAPRLWARTMLNTGSTKRASYNCSARSMSCLVYWSSPTSAALSASQRSWIIPVPPRLPTIAPMAHITRSGVFRRGR